MSTSTILLIIAVIVANMAVWIMFFQCRKAWKYTKIANESSYRLLRDWKDAVEDKRRILDKYKKLDESYTCFISEYRNLQKKYDDLLQKYIEKTGEEYEEQ